MEEIIYTQRAKRYMTVRTGTICIGKYIELDI